MTEPFTLDAGLDHLHALELRLSHERSRLAKCRSKSERALREVWCIQAAQEVGRERQRLGLPAESLEAISDDQLLAELLYDGRT